ncbi:MAG: Serine/threonine-protein kinase pkn3 [Labilithrix sp.]|nr:Serine/threonine-protein kinase pkn3 [Labilithrix sp.]
MIDEAELPIVAWEIDLVYSARMPTAGSRVPTPGLPVAGDVLGGKYEIVRLLGEGGMASVFEASHKRLEQRVAIKLLCPELASDAELVARFEREARAMGKLTTKHVVRVIDVEETPAGLPYMVMELLSGRDLDAEIQARKRLPLGEAVDIILQACSGMLEAHAEGIVHRDLKPANLFLTEDRDTKDRVVKILDFGISKVGGEDMKLTSAGAVMGTVLYMSPEQVRGESNVDEQADVWSLGVILYELLAGRAPFDGSSQQIATQIVSQDAPELRTHVSVPEDVAFGVRRMLERDRSRRFRSLSEVIATLAPFALPGSLGADIARQQAIAAAGATGTRGKTVVLAAKHTVQMGGPVNARPVDRSPSYDGHSTTRAVLGSAHPPAARRSAPVASLPTPRVEPGDPAAKQSRTFFGVAVVIALLGAIGVVLIILVLVRR